MPLTTKPLAFSGIEADRITIAIDQDQLIGAPSRPAPTLANIVLHNGQLSAALPAQGAGAVEAASGAAAANAAVAADALGPVLPVLARLGATPGVPVMRGAACWLEGEIPAARVHDLQQQLPGLTHGDMRFMHCRCLLKKDYAAFDR